MLPANEGADHIEEGHILDESGDVGSKDLAVVRHDSGIPNVSALYQREREKHGLCHLVDPLQSQTWPSALITRQRLLSPIWLWFQVACLQVAQITRSFARLADSSFLLFLLGWVTCHLSR